MHHSRIHRIWMQLSFSDKIQAQAILNAFYKYWKIPPGSQTFFCDAKKGVPDIEGERDTILNGVVPKVIRDKTFIAPKDNGGGRANIYGAFFSHIHGDGHKLNTTSRRKLPREKGSSF